MGKNFIKPIDHRGQPLIEVVAEGIEHLAASENIPKPVRQRLARELDKGYFNRPLSPHTLVWMLCFGIGMLAVRIFLDAIGLGAWGWRGTGTSIVAGLTVGLAARIASWFLPLRSNRALLDALVREGYCPGCGYHLRELPVEADGCTVCPECGAAWKLSATTDATSPPT